MPAETAYALKISPFQRSRQILSAETLAEAVKGADKYATAKIMKGPMAAGLLRTAKWRHQPATDNQKSFIRKRWLKRKTSAADFDDAEEQKKLTDIAKLTKGDAANIISRLKHGAQSRHEKKVKTIRKENAKVAKEALRKAREHVAVGPLPVPEPVP
ncbi:hypothetical protein EIP86_004452 [Pleurotus ostreatoroseus]|nr:hypothetical protein EIP86_004452 [Pleurotus ostreatoroseus]